MHSVSSKLNTSFSPTLSELSSQPNLSSEVGEKETDEIRDQLNQRSEKTYWFLIEEVRKISSYAKAWFVNMGWPCFNLIRYYWPKGILEKASNYGEKAFKYLKQCYGAYPTYLSLGSRSCFLISNYSKAYLHILQAFAYPSPEKNPQAIEHFEKCLKIFQDLGDRSREGTTYANLGIEYLSLGEYFKAAEHFEKCLKIFQDLGDRSREEAIYAHLETAYRSLGRYHQVLGEYHQVIQYGQMCLKIAQYFGDLAAQGSSYGNLGIAYSSLGKYAKAIECHKKSLKIFQDLGDRGREEASYGNLGIAYRSLGEYSKAIEYHKKSLKIAQELKDRGNQGKIYTNLGVVYQSRGEYRQAIKCHEKALKIAQNCCDLVGQAKIYQNLGIVHYCLGDCFKAIECYEKSLNIAQDLGDRTAEGSSYTNLGIAYDSLGEYCKAVKYHEKALEIALELRDRAAEGRAYGNLKHVYFSLGEYCKAVEYLGKALEIILELGDRAAEGRAYGSLGNAYQSQGEYRKAIKYYEKDLQIALELGDLAGEGGAYGNLGNAHLGIAYVFQREYRKTSEYHEKALEIKQDLEDRAGGGGVYENLDVAHSSLEECRKGIEYLEKALKIAQDLRNRVIEESIYGSLGNAYYFLGEYRKTIEYHEKALKINQDLRNWADEGRTYANLGLAYEQLNDLPRSKQFFLQSIYRFSNLQQKLGDNHQWKITIFEEQSKAHTGLERVLLKQKEIQQALEVTDARRSRALVAALSNRSSPLANRSLELISMPIEELFSSGKIFSAPVKGAGSLRSPAPREKGLFKDLSLDSAVFREGSNSSRWPTLNSRDYAELSVQEMQDLAQKLQTMFAVYSLDPWSAAFISVWIIPIEGEIIYRSIPIDTFSEELKDASRLLKQFPYISTRPTRPVRVRGEDFELDPVQELPTLPFLEEMQELYRGGGKGGTGLEKFKERLVQWYTALIAPIQDYLPQDSTQTVTIVPDEFLSQLPFAAFLDSEGKYLIEKHPICTAPSLKALQLLDQLPKEFPSGSLAIGNPTTPNLKEELKLSEKEVKEKVAPILDIPPDKIWTQQACTVRRVLEEMPKARFIHLACHGLSGDKPEEKLDPHSVFEGVLKLAPDETHKNGYLYAPEIAALSLQADLVFMSACFSGRGKLQREGTIGHNWSFLAAGARSTISTHWRLPESELTLQMVETFYRHLLGKEARKLSKAQALQQAMLMAIEKDRDNPHKWGAFFLSGLDGEYDPTLSSQLVSEKTRIVDSVDENPHLPKEGKEKTTHSMGANSTMAFSSESSFLNPSIEIHSAKQSLSHTQKNTKFNHFWGTSLKNTSQISIREMNNNPWKVRGFSKMVQEPWLEKQLKALCAESVDWVGSITDANCDLVDLSSLLNEANKDIPTCLLINSHLHYSLIIYDPGKQTIYRFNSLSIQQNELEKKVIEKIQELLQVKQVVLNKRISQNGIEDGWSCAFHVLYFLERFLQGCSMDMIDQHPLSEAALAHRFTDYYHFLSEELTKIPQTHLHFFNESLAEKSISQVATILKAICTQGFQAQKDEKPILDSWLQIECILVKLWLLQQEDPSVFKQFIEQMTHFTESERKFLREALDQISYQREPIVDLFLKTYKSKYQRAI